MRERLAHLKKITRWGWFVTYELGWVTLFTNIDLIVGKYGSEHTKTLWERLTHPHWGWRVWLIGAVIIFAIFLWEGSFRSYKELQEKVNNLERRITGIPGPELQIFYDMSQPGSLNAPLGIRNLRGGTAYRVSIEGLEYETFTANLEEIDMVPEGEIRYPQSWTGGNRWGQLKLTIGDNKSPVAKNLRVVCEDSSNRKFEYLFEFKYRNGTLPTFRPLKRAVVV